MGFYGGYTPQTYHTLSRDQRQHFLAYVRSRWSDYASASEQHDPALMSLAFMAIQLVPRDILVRSRGGNAGRKVRMLKNLIKKAMAAESHDPRLRPSYPPPPPRPPIDPHHPPPPAVADRPRVDRSQLQLQGGHFSRAARTLLQQNQPELTEQVIEQLRTKFPPWSPAASIPPPPLDSTPQFIDPAKLQDIVKKQLANGSSPGPSLWTGELYLIMLTRDESTAGPYHQTLTLRGTKRWEVRRGRGS